MPHPLLNIQEVKSLHEYPPIHAPDHCNTIPTISKSHFHHRHCPRDLYLCSLCLGPDHSLYSLSLCHQSLFLMPYFPTSPSYEPFHMPPSNSQPIRLSLLSTSWIHTLYTLVIASRRPSSSLSKDSPATRQMSPANSLSSSSITLHLHKCNTSELAQMTYLMSLASLFALPSPSCLDQSSNCLTPTPSTTT